jgi:hypothetical protein
MFFGRDVADVLKHDNAIVLGSYWHDCRSDLEQG